MDSRIKICGIQYKEEIKIINQLPIDYIGFVFAPSKRKITIDQAKALINILNDDIKTVGVFVNEPPQRVNKIAHTLNLDVVQLHGDENIEFISTIDKQVWKAYRVDKYFTQKKIIKRENITGNLFDGKNPGSGEVFNWQLIEKISCDALKILAGGLAPENIEEAVKRVKPDVVDISSGVERNNKKDELLLKRLVRRIQNV